MDVKNEILEQIKKLTRSKKIIDNFNYLYNIYHEDIINIIKNKPNILINTINRYNRKNNEELRLRHLQIVHKCIDKKYEINNNYYKDLNNKTFLNKLKKLYIELSNVNESNENNQDMIFAKNFKKYLSIN